MSVKYPNYLVPKTLAKKLKEIGFNKKCHLYVSGEDIFTRVNVKSTERGEFIEDVLIDNIHSNLQLPYWEDVFEWFRDKGLYGYILHTPWGNDSQYYFRIHMMTTGLSFEEFMSIKDSIELYSSKDYNTYNKCRFDLVDQLIKSYKENEHRL